MPKIQNLVYLDRLLYQILKFALLNLCMIFQLKFAYRANRIWLLYDLWGMLFMFDVITLFDWLEAGLHADDGATMFF